MRRRLSVRAAAGLLALALLLVLALPTLAQGDEDDAWDFEEHDAEDDDTDDDNDDEEGGERGKREGKGRGKLRLHEARGPEPRLPLRDLDELLERVAEEPPLLDRALDALRERRASELPSPRLPDLEAPRMDVPAVSLGPQPGGGPLAVAGGVAMAAAKHLIVVGVVGTAAGLLWLAHRPRAR